MSTARSRCWNALHSGQVLLMDGAMGTEIQRAGARDGDCLELWNLIHPDRIHAIHQAYFDAGARCLVTNTFQASPGVLRGKGVRQGDWQHINQRGVELARSAGDGRQLVLASIGPPPDLWGDWVPAQAKIDEAADDLLQQITWLRSADAILLETQSCLVLIAALLRRKLEVIDSIPLLVSFTYLKQKDEPPRTPNRVQPDVVAVYLEDKRDSVAALGANCGRDIGISDVIDIVRACRTRTQLPLFARPNAGTPSRSDGSWHYPLSPSAIAERLPELLTAGVTMIGGCCGTTPAHVAAMRPVVERWNSRSSREP